MQQSLLGLGTYYEVPSSEAFESDRRRAYFFTHLAERAHDELAQSRSVCLGGWVVKGGSAMPGWPLLLRREMAALYIGMSPSTFDAERKAGRVPKPIQITNGLDAWHVSDLEAWAEDRRAAMQASVGANEWD